MHCAFWVTKFPFHKQRSLWTQGQSLTAVSTLHVVHFGGLRSQPSTHFGSHWFHFCGPGVTANYSFWVPLVFNVGIHFNAVTFVGLGPSTEPRISSGESPNGSKIRFERGSRCHPGSLCFCYFIENMYNNIPKINLLIVIYIYIYIYIIN